MSEGPWAYKFNSATSAFKYQAAAATAAAASNIINKMRSGKRKRGGNTALQNSRDPQHAGGVTGANYTCTNGTIKMRKKKLRRLQKIMLKDKLRDTSVIARYQGLSTYVYKDKSLGTNSLFYTMDKRFLDVNQNSSWMPVYAFNLTSSPITDRINNTTLAGYTYPFYRLWKLIDAAAATDKTHQNYGWTPLAGQNDTGATATIKSYIIEQNNTAASTGDTTSVKTTDVYEHLWSRVGLTLSNNGKTPIRFHIATVQFKNRYAGPMRRYYDGAAEQVYDINDATKYMSQADLWWDHFLSNKTAHPLRTAIQGTRTKDVVLKTYECICLEPSPLNTGPATVMGPVHTWKKFVENGSLYKCINPDVIEGTHKPNLNAGIGVVNPVMNYNVFSTADSGRQTPFPAREKDTWLLIWIEDYGITKTSNDISNPDVTFDLAIRSKFSYNNN